MEFRGTYTAMVTPFRNGAVDFEAFSNLLDIQKSAAVSGVVPCGCTGEAATLDNDERSKLLETALNRVGDTLQVVVGTGTNSTETTIQQTKEAERVGAHAAMLITPYYNKPSQSGLLEHYTRVGEATTIPLILYNVPGRTGVTLSAETISKLFESGRYSAVKEAAGSLDAFSDIRAASNVSILSGDDPLTVPMLALGGVGVVSVVSNLVPASIREMVDHALNGRMNAAADLHFRLLPIMRAAFIESNPSPIKAMLSMKGLLENELRAPLAPVGSKSIPVIRRAMDTLDEVRSA